jgi:DNA-binding NtrC family response regulator
LLPHTVITDPKVAEVYGQLRTLAVQPGRIKICLTGEAGSGKYRAAQQLAAWRGVSDVGRCFSPEPPAQPPAFLIVAQADLIPLDAFPHWNEWLEGHPEVQVVFLCRDHERAEALINGQGGLASGELQLRGWRERSDQLELVKAMLAEAGRPTTKVDERFQYELLRYPTVKNLHGLRAWLTTLAATSETPNISEAAIESVRQAPELWAKRRRLRRQLHQLLGRAESFPKAWKDAGVTLDEIEKAARGLFLESLKIDLSTDPAVADYVGVAKSTVQMALRRGAEALDSIRSKLAAKGVDWIG